MDLSILNQWTDLRYSYYLSGRTLLFNNQMQSGVLMLGYAIEAHFKSLLSQDKSVAKKLSFKHDFHKAYQACLGAGYLTDIDVSEDFLLFVEDNFDRRYPSQFERTIKRANDRGHAISMAPDVIIPYDSFILQLDQSITRSAGTPESSILLRGAKEVDCAGGEYFFHSNYCPISLLDYALDLCKEDLLLLKQREPDIYDINLQAHQEREVYLKNPDKLLNSDKIGMGVHPTGGIEGALQSAKNFVYPGRVIRHDDGTEVHMSSY